MYFEAKRADLTLLITGGSGALGSAIKTQAGMENRVAIAPSHQDFDITDFKQCSGYMSTNPVDVLVHCAAQADWNRCHDDPENAFRVNALGAYNMARLAVEQGKKLVFVSTDAVFPGTMRDRGYAESDIPNIPVSVYGMSKLTGEYLARSVDPGVLITRIGWLFGPQPEKDKKFVGAIIRQIASGREFIQAVDDKVGSPSYSLHVARRILQYVDNNVTGVRHLSNSGLATRFDVAEEIARLWGSNTRVDRVTSDKFYSIVRRPDYAVLSTDYSDAILPHWRQALEEYYNAFPDAKSFL